MCNEFLFVVPFAVLVLMGCKNRAREADSNDASSTSAALVALQRGTRGFSLPLPRSKFATAKTSRRRRTQRGPTTYRNTLAAPARTSASTNPGPPSPEHHSIAALA